MTDLLAIANASALLLIVIAVCSKAGRFVGLGALIMLGVAGIVSL